MSSSHTYYRTMADRRRRACEAGIAAEEWEDYLRVLDPDDPDDRVLAVHATRELATIRDWIANLPDSDMDIWHVIG